MRNTTIILLISSASAFSERSRAKTGMTIITHSKGHQLSAKKNDRELHANDEQSLNDLSVKLLCLQAMANKKTGKVGSCFFLLSARTRFFNTSFCFPPFLLL